MKQKETIFVKLNNNDNQLFHDRFSERHDAPRTNFDNFLKAMLAVFQVSYVSDVLKSS